MKQPRFEMMGQIVITLTLCLIACPALAGIVDTPLPTLVAGKKTFHVYSVPGIPAIAGVQPFFSCTSTDTATMQVGVEVFGDFGGDPANDAVATSLSVLPGGTAVFTTGATPVAINFNSNLGTGAVFVHSARILATSKKLACTVFMADVENAPPTSMVCLTIIKKTTQKGE